MDNDMIVQYINGVEPDFSYGTSDGMSRAMVESVENMAMINDYITESTYEVITEAKDDKPGFWGKLGNKISYYFTLFMKLVNKFITKIKGFFMMVKRKLTVAFAKAIKAVAGFLRNRINNNKKKFDKVDEEDEVKKYKWNEEAVDEVIRICTTSEDPIDKVIINIANNVAKNDIAGIDDKGHNLTIKKGDYKAAAKYALITSANMNKNNTTTPSAEYDKVVEQFNDIKDKLNNIVVNESENNNNGAVALLSEALVTFSPNDVDSFLKTEFNQNVSKYVDKVYNGVMNGTKNIIKLLKEVEKIVKKCFKKTINKDSATFSDGKTVFKTINYSINQFNLLRYRASGKMASACFKYYKKLFSAVRKVFGGINIFGKSGDVEEKNESADLLYALQ